MEASEDEQRLIKEIDKEINKLRYFLEETEEMVDIKDYTEMERGLSPRSVRVVKGIFVTRDRPFLFPVKCEIAIFFPRES